ncbi:hypothetical protein MAMC_01403 [Methylacidimicrobium cyclopophantes]|uniref:Uncharacterized protein n=1 Tax=Methylacidimicrobium cyclopophantes TaxID=1041766 RepID=A0A5E6MNK6_9BACT|nr:hypothetical protein MAMC_01403 [Methylacidimicrobium cyclopophantes]
MPPSVVPSILGVAVSASPAVYTLVSQRPFLGIRAAHKEKGVRRRLAQQTRGSGSDGLALGCCVGGLLRGLSAPAPFVRVGFSLSLHFVLRL